MGLLSDLPRKNCWSIAEWAGQATSDGMPPLLGQAKWEANTVREYVLDHLHDEDAMLAVDGPGMQKEHTSANTPTAGGSKTRKSRSISSTQAHGGAP
nr:hypothetical protein GCM10010200_046700 [Actinomadura rugatobispora]